MVSNMYYVQTKFDLKNQQTNKSKKWRHFKISYLGEFIVEIFMDIILLCLSSNSSCIVSDL